MKPATRICLGGANADRNRGASHSFTYLDKHRTIMCVVRNIITRAVQTGGQNSLAFAAIAFAAIRRHTGWWPATVAIASYLLPKQEGVTSNCSKRAICCNYLERILTPCPAYLCSLKYLAFKVTLKIIGTLSCLVLNFSSTSYGGMPSGVRSIAKKNFLLLRDNDK